MPLIQIHFTIITNLGNVELGYGLLKPGLPLDEIGYTLEECLQKINHNKYNTHFQKI